MTTNVDKTPDNKKRTSVSSPLPPEKMPECWNEDQRMNALFSPFRGKSVNSQDWSSKYKFWHDIILEWLRHSMQCSFSVPQLSEAFKRKNCRPLCLTTVLEELLRNREIMSEEEFLRESGDTWTAWSIDVFIRKPLFWSVSQIKNYMGNEKIDVNIRYVHLGVVKELGDIILTALEEEKRNVLVPVSEVLRYCRIKAANERITEDSVRLALIWLKRSKKAAFRRNSIGSNSELLVKISPHIVQNVTETEEGLYKLLKQESELIKEIESMELDKLGIINKAKDCVSKGLKQVAKTHLRKKAELEKTIEKRANALENLRALISSIQDSHSNCAVLAAYETGSSVLKKIGQSGLTEDTVRDAIDEISEAIEDQKDIQSTLSEALCQNDTDLDLEQELADLMASDNKTESAVDSTDIESEIGNLEARLRKLNVPDLPISGESPKRSTTTTIPSKKKLSEVDTV